MDFDSFTVFMCLLGSKKNLKGSLQPKLKGASVWPFNARSKVKCVQAESVIYDYSSGTVKKNRSMSSAVISRAILRAPAGPGRGGPGRAGF